MEIAIMDAKKVNHSQLESSQLHDITILKNTPIPSLNSYISLLSQKISYLFGPSMMDMMYATHH